MRRHGLEWWIIDTSTLELTLGVRDDADHQTHFSLEPTTVSDYRSPNGELTDFQLAALIDELDLASDAEYEGLEPKGGLDDLA